MKIKERRTIRKYKETEVSDSLLNELLTTASRAATMGNMQLYSVVVTKEEKIKSAYGVLSPVCGLVAYIHMMLLVFIC